MSPFLTHFLSKKGPKTVLLFEYSEYQNEHFLYILY